MILPMLCLWITVKAEIEAVRLSLIPDGMTVGWTTDTPYQTAPKLSWGYGPSLGSTTIGVASSYGTKWFNYVTVQNLSAATQVFYQIDDSPIGSFVTAPAIGSMASYPFTVMHVGDLGVEHSENTMALMKQRVEYAAFILHSGDISYADSFAQRVGTPYDTYEGTWDAWQLMMEPITAAKPYMVIPGLCV